MKSHVTGSAPPAPVVRKDVYRVTTREPQQFVILSEAVHGQDTHWYGARSWECTKAKTGTCKGCEEGWTAKWKAYLHVARPGAVTWDGFLEFTASAFRLLEAQVSTRATLRGTMVRIAKTSGGAKGRYLVEVLERVEDSPGLPAAKDPYPTLQYLWSCKRSSGH